MNYKRNFSTASIVLLVLLARLSYATPAFPGAEGYGANAIGGRGGRVIKVTNLNDSGTGSLRDALKASGPRIVVFEVSGIINILRDITIDNPFITIAGQTSPGGILVSGGHLRIVTNNVIMRFMRLRPGSHVGDPNGTHALEILGPTWASGTAAHTLIVDHCSLGWGIDETLGMTGGVLNATISWSIIGEGLNNAGHDKANHSKGAFISTFEARHPSSVTFHHNFLPLSVDRVPFVQDKGGQIDSMNFDGRNNVTYGWKGGLSPAIDAHSQVDWVQNYARGNSISHAYAYEVTINPNSSVRPILFVKGNIGNSRNDQSDPEWNVGEGWRDKLASTGWQRHESWGHPPVTTTIMSNAYADEIVATAGATVPFRDSADAAVAMHFTNRTGRAPSNVTYPDDFPTYPNLPVPADNDNDGMADSWEVANGLNPTTDDSAADADGDGYTNIEEYLNYLADDVAVVRPMPPADL